MPITDIVALSIIILAFVVFAVVLAWAEHRTRRIVHRNQDRQKQNRAAAEVRVLKTPARADGEKAGNVVGGVLL